MRLGMIGCGNMAAAMIKGILDKGLALPEEILASDRNAAARARGTALGVAVTEDNRKAAAWAEILVVAVKPQFYGAVLEEIRDCRRGFPRSGWNIVWGRALRSSAPCPTRRPWWGKA